MHSKRVLNFIVGMILGLASASALAERPPTGAKALSTVLDAVDSSHPGTVISAEFDDRRWTVVTCAGEGRACRELGIDPLSGKEVRSSSESEWGRRPPAGGKTAAQIARSVEERNLGVITELEFDHPAWEVSVRADAVRAKLYLDPVTGDLQRCRGRGCPSR
jgi:hypothetical protein